MVVPEVVVLEDQAYAGVAMAKLDVGGEAVYDVSRNGYAYPVYVGAHGGWVGVQLVDEVGEEAQALGFILDVCAPGAALLFFCGTDDARMARVCEALAVAVEGLLHKAGGASCASEEDILVGQEDMACQICF
jgi:hypothetical protein